MAIGYRDHLQNRNGRLFVEGASVGTLARVFGTPLYVYSESRIRENYRRLYRALAKHINGVSIAYSFKANANRAILNILQEEGASGDCASPKEVVRARKAKMEEVVYTGIFASRDELHKVAPETDILVLDDASRIASLKGAGFNGILSFRVNSGSGKGSHPGVVTGGDTKFGIPRAVLASAYQEAIKSGFKRFGLHMMSGSGVCDWREFVKRIKTALTIAKSVEDELGIAIATVDIGGGFGIPYKDGDSELDVEKMAKGMGEMYKKIVAQMRGEVRIILEPGRYIVGDAGILISTVTAIKTEPKRYIGIDAGMHTLVRPAMYGAYHEVLVANKLNLRLKTSATIVGPICETTDVLAENRAFPSVEEGDIFAILDTGAYGRVMSSEYGDRGLPNEALVLKSSYKNISERII